MKWKVVFLNLIIWLLCTLIGSLLSLYVVDRIERKTNLTLSELNGLIRSKEKMRNSSRNSTAIHEIGHTLIFRKNFPEEFFIIQIDNIDDKDGKLGGLHYREFTKYSAKTIPLILMVHYGGRVAEELVLGKDLVSTGSSSDMDSALTLATKLTYNVLNNPYSGKFFPPMNLTSWAEITGLYLPEGADVALQQDILSLMQQGYMDAKQHLEPQKEVIEKLTEELLLKRRMTKEEFEEALKKAQTSS